MGFKDLLLNNKQQRQQNKINQLNKKGMELMQSLLYKEALDFF